MDIETQKMHKKSVFSMPVEKLLNARGTPSDTSPSRGGHRAATAQSANLGPESVLGAACCWGYSGLHALSTPQCISPGTKNVFTIRSVEDIWCHCGGRIRQLLTVSVRREYYIFGPGGHELGTNNWGGLFLNTIRVPVDIVHTHVQQRELPQETATETSFHVMS